jgi:hypothetical protein
MPQHLPSIRERIKSKNDTVQHSCLEKVGEGEGGIYVLIDNI